MNLFFIYFWKPFLQIWLKIQKKKFWNLLIDVYDTPSSKMLKVTKNPHVENSMDLGPTTGTYSGLLGEILLVLVLVFLEFELRVQWKTYNLLYTNMVALCYIKVNFYFLKLNVENYLSDVSIFDIFFQILRSLEGL